MYNTHSSHYNLSTLFLKVFAVHLYLLFYQLLCYLNCELQYRAMQFKCEKKKLHNINSENTSTHAYCINLKYRKSTPHNFLAIEVSMEIFAFSDFS